MTQPPAPETFHDIRALLSAAPSADDVAGAAARAREARLTKPAGALGRLEQLVVWLAQWQGRHPPVLDDVRVLIFAGNHGVARRRVSAFPAEVTVQMVANFEAGGAAINQLSRFAGAELSVLALDLERPTADFTEAPAMDQAECLAALRAGYQAVPPGAELVVLGEMGIANTTAAAALSAALLGGTAEDWVGRGTGVDDFGLARKRAVVARALAHHGDALADPLEALRRLGGREIAALTGAILACRLAPVPVVLDGYVVGAAAAVLARLAEGALEHALAGHCSAEPGHRRLLQALAMAPLLDLDMRLGEASGGALAVVLLRAALATHLGMASFAEAGVASAVEPS